MHTCDLSQWMPRCLSRVFLVLLVLFPTLALTVSLASAGREATWGAFETRYRPYETPYASSVAAAGPRYVAVGGGDAGNDCTVSSNPCATVQHAVDVANPGE